MEKKYSLLIVDDEKDIIEMLYDYFRNDYNVHKALNVSEGLDILKENEIHLVMTDQRMPDMQGTELLAKVKQEMPEITRILMTGYMDLEAAIEAINKGSIHRYLTKPLNFDELGDIISEGIQCYEQAVKVRNLISEEKNDIIGKIKSVMSHLKTAEEGRGELEHELKAAKQVEDTIRTNMEQEVKTLTDEKNVAFNKISAFEEKVVALEDDIKSALVEGEKAKQFADENVRIQTEFKELESKFSIANKTSLSLKTDLETMGQDCEAAKAEKNRMEKKLKQFQMNWGKAVA